MTTKQTSRRELNPAFTLESKVHLEISGVPFGTLTVLLLVILAGIPLHISVTEVTSDAPTSASPIDIDHGFRRTPRDVTRGAHLRPASYDGVVTEDEQTQRGDVGRVSPTSRRLKRTPATPGGYTNDEAAVCAGQGGPQRRSPPVVPCPEQARGTLTDSPARAQLTPTRPTRPCPLKRHGHLSANSALNSKYRRSAIRNEVHHRIRGRPSDRGRQLGRERGMGVRERATHDHASRGPGQAAV